VTNDILAGVAGADYLYAGQFGDAQALLEHSTGTIIEPDAFRGDG
jgi:hypothetical protein